MFYDRVRINSTLVQKLNNLYEDYNSLLEECSKSATEQQTGDNAERWRKDFEADEHLASCLKRLRLLDSEITLHQSILGRKVYHHVVDKGLQPYSDSDSPPTFKEMSDAIGNATDNLILQKERNQ